MLGEVAITPDVFKEYSYSIPGTSGIHLQALREPLLREMLVRNLHDGDWIKSVQNYMEDLAPRAKELLKKLVKQNRLRNSPPVHDQVPLADEDWCKEALDSHVNDPLGIVITCRNTKALYLNDPLAVCVEDLLGHSWWTSRSPSIQLRRTTADYLQKLGRVLCSANSLMFIDPHLDPSRSNYREFFELLRRCERADIPPLIELHRVCYTGTGASRHVYAEAELEDMFRVYLKPKIMPTTARIEVFVWDDFHDRCLITDLIGIQLSNGFDVSDEVNNTTTWGRLGITDRDNIQREFDRSCSPRELRHWFVI